MREHAVAFGTDFRTSVLAGNGNARGRDAGVRFDEDCGILLAQGGGFGWAG